ncbi:MAG: putative transporter, permease protein [Actinomycetota bacterium]|jgi:peptide/nickel transport system permease protein
MQCDGSESAFRDNGMKNLARRALFTIGAFVSLAVLSFLGIDALPGDGCTALLGRFGTEAKIAECRVEHNLNDPVVVRLGSWASDVVQGDLGYSIKRDEQVAQIVLPRIRNTAMLALVAAVMAFPTAIVAGLLIGRFPRSRIGRAINTLGVVAMTLPEFVIATILWLVFSIWIPIFPGVTVVPSNATFMELLPHIWMPALTLAAVVFAHSMRTMKAGVTTIQAMPFVESARLRGTKERVTLLRHILPAALPPVVNTIAVDAAWLLTGTFVTEAIFNYRGLGRLTIDAISDRDTAVILPIVLFSLGAYLTMSLIADTVVRLLDPRLRQHQS